MEIGILYICTWKYDVFWKDFYISCEKYFLKDYEKHYFVFTDSEKIYDEENNKNIHKFYQKNLWWPDNTLLRFHIFLSQEKKLKKMDYLFFFNANLEIKKEIWEEFLPKKEWLLVVKHPWYYNRPINKYTYERNKKSTAYISNTKWKVYVQWALNWWKTKDFLNMCKNLSQNIDTDKSNWIIAKWHDESHLNKYILNHKYKLLDPSYLYPEWWNIPFECKILIRDKSKWIDVDNIKWYKFWFLKNIIRKIIWLFKK